MTEPTFETHTDVLTVVVSGDVTTDWNMAREPLCCAEREAGARVECEVDPNSTRRRTAMWRRDEEAEGS